MALIRRFGVTKAAGVAVIEKPAQEAITPAKLGVAALVGMFERGKVSTVAAPAFNLCSGERIYRRRMGGRISASLAPDAAFDYFEHGEGAGELICVRVTDGNELTPEVTLYSRDWGTDYVAPNSEKGGRSQLKIPILKVKAKNAGRWGGRARTLTGILSAANKITETTIDAELPAGTLKENEFAGAELLLVGSAKTYEVVSNTAVGVFTVKTGSTMSTDYTASGSANLNFLVRLTRPVLDTGGRKGLAVRLRTAEEDPANNFGLDVFVDGVLANAYDTLSMDSASKFYAPKIISEDRSQDEIEVTDLIPAGTAIAARLRPANHYGRNVGVTATTLTFAPFQVYSVGDANVTVVAVSMGTDPIPHRLTFTWVLATNKYTVAASAIGEGGVTIRNLPDFVVGAAAQYAKVYTATNKHTVGVTIDHAAAPANSSTFIIDVLPLNKDALVGGLLYPNASGSPLKFLRIKSATYNVATVESGDPSAIATTPTTATYTGALAENFAIVLGASDKMKLRVDKRSTVDVTLTAGAARTAAQVAADINAAFDLKFGAGVLNPASAAAGKVVFTSPGGLNGNGPGSIIEILDVATNAYVVLGFAVSTTYGVAGSEAEVRFLSESAGGHDGGAPTDQKYIDALSIADSPLNRLSGRGVMGLALPGVTSTAVQKQAILYAEAKNHMFHLEFPSNTTADDAAVDYVNTTIGRSDHLIPYFPTYVEVPDPDMAGRNKSIPVTGMVLGKRAKFARLFQGYHRPAAGEDATLPEIVDTPIGDRVIDEEMLTPQGINVIKKIGANYVIWGGRSAFKSAGFRFHTHRFQLSHYEHTFIDSFGFVIFALNNASTRMMLKAVFENFFRAEYKISAIDGTSFEDAASIKIDDENNPQAEVDAGNLNVELILRLATFVERLQITISKAGVFEGTS